MEALPDERRVVEQAKSGDPEAFAQLYDASLERLYRYIFFRVSDQQTAEDLTSQVFLKAWEKLAQYQPRGSFIGWLYAIARTEFESVQAAMQRLMEDQREVLILKFIAELDTAQIARRLGKSQGAIRALPMRALQALARVIEVKDQQ